MVWVLVDQFELAVEFLFASKMNVTCMTSYRTRHAPSRYLLNSNPNISQAGKLFTYSVIRYLENQQAYLESCNNFLYHIILYYIISQEFTDS